jgi:uncharacterized protein involved in exopolysaccharide biosynthesis
MTKESKNTGFVYDAFDLIKFILEKKWIFIGIFIVTVITSVIVSFEITPRFKSSVIVFPVASVSVAKDLLETSSLIMETRDILSYGREDESERLLQILHSNQIMEHIEKKYDLMNHYSIKKNARYPKTELDNAFKGNVKFKRTEFISVEISVIDIDPKYAADIANDIADYVDSTIHIMQRERSGISLQIVKNEMESTQQEITLLRDSLQKMHKTGSIDSKSQGTSSELYGSPLAKKIDLANKYGVNYFEVFETLESAIERLEHLKVKYASSRVNVVETIPNIFIVDRAVVPEKKDSPKRALLVFMSTISTLALAFIILLIIDNIKVRLS